MRAFLLILGSAMIATPAVAQTSAEPRAPDRIEIPAELTDPEMVGRLTDMMQLLSKALLDLPVGELAAAAEGREASPQEKRVTVRDLERRGDPNFERNLERQIADARPAIEAAVQALASALPAMMRGMSEAREELERATANVPRPDYPKR